ICELPFAGTARYDDEVWLRTVGETIPADPSDGMSELRSGNGGFFTSDPVLFALAYESWWHRNGRLRPDAPQVSIPLMAEAISIVRNREILNDFNRRHRGTVPFLDRQQPL